MDLSVKKDILVTERYHLEFSSVFSNVFNHNQLFDPGSSAGTMVLGETADWGALEGQVNSPRKVELGLRFRF